MKLILLLSLITLSVSAQQVYEAEGCYMTDNLNVYNVNKGFSGSAYVGNFKGGNLDTLTFKVNIIKAGEYDFILRMWPLWGERRTKVILNEGFPVELKSNGTFDNWQDLPIVKGSFKKGMNNLSVIGNWGFYYIDNLTVFQTIDSIQVLKDSINTLLEWNANQREYIESFIEQNQLRYVYTADTVHLKIECKENDIYIEKLNDEVTIKYKPQNY